MHGVMPVEDRFMEWDKCWNSFQTALYNSLISIEPRYFTLTREGKYILRERVYCYELYHQLRCNLGNWEMPFVLQAEIDKSGQEEFCRIFNQRPPNPDFVFHGPGFGENNFVIMEVKSSSTFSKNGAQNDMNKIEKFTKEFGYRHGVFLIFGSINSKGSERDIRRLVDKLSIDEELISNGKLCVLWHKKCRQDCEQPVEVITGSFNANPSAVI